MTLSHEEFAGLPGGSRRYTDAGISRGGYYVSRNPEIPVEQGGSKEIVSDRSLATGAVEKHWDETRTAALAATPVGDRHLVHQGIWNDPEHGKTYLDISDKKATLGEALETGMQNKQRAIYAKGAGKSITTMEQDESGNVTRTKPSAQLALNYDVRQRAQSRVSKKSKLSKSEKLRRLNQDIVAIKNVK